MNKIFLLMDTYSDEIPQVEACFTTEEKAKDAMDQLTGEYEIMPVEIDPDISIKSAAVSIRLDGIITEVRLGGFSRNQIAEGWHRYGERSIWEDNHIVGKVEYMQVFLPAKDKHDAICKAKEYLEKHNNRGKIAVTYKDGREITPTGGELKCKRSHRKATKIY